ncbi:hypothetical protein OAF12_06115 [Akkermansiaceae bacterium]|nr:hypothetical protein [Akkermansiaceae bacterium]
MKNQIYFILFCLITIRGFAESEIVRRSDGSLAKLEENGTWSVVQDNQLKGKVVFTVVKIQPNIPVNGKNFEVKKDAFGNIEKYSYTFGIDFEIEVKNHTEHVVSIGSFEINTTSSEFDNQIGGKTSVIKFALMPNESRKKGFSLHKTLYSEKQLGDKELNKKRSLFSLEALKGTLYVSNIEYGAGLASPLITFDPKAKISPDAAESHVIGNLNGVFPLKEKVKFHIRKN